VLKNNITDVMAGAYHTCAVVDRVLNCWGANAYGQLGNGVPAPVVGPEVVAPAPGTPVAVGLGWRHGCGTWAGETFCWGNGEALQTGNLSEPVFSPPLMFSTPLSVAMLAAGQRHTCALNAGSVICWGDGWDGQLGTAYLDASSATPVTIPGLPPSGIVDLVAAGWTSCVHDGTKIYCWGANNEGQAGVDPATSPAPPGSITASFTSVSAITLGPSHGCAVVNTEGNIGCWGSNWLGELGPLATFGSDVFSLVTTDEDTTTPIKGFTSVAAGAEFSCGLKNDGSVWCWGSHLAFEHSSIEPYDPVPKPVPGVFDATKLVAGYTHACAQTTAGALTCWGETSLGQLGAHPDAPTRKPTIVWP